MTPATTQCCLTETIVSNLLVWKSEYMKMPMNIMLLLRTCIKQGSHLELDGIIQLLFKINTLL